MMEGKQHAWICMVLYKKKYNTYNTHIYNTLYNILIYNLSLCPSTHPHIQRFMLFIKLLKIILARAIPWPCARWGLTVPSLGAPQCVLQRPKAKVSWPVFLLLVWPSHLSWGFGPTLVLPGFVDKPASFGPHSLSPDPHELDGTWIGLFLLFLVQISSKSPLLPVLQPQWSESQMLRVWFAKGFRKC